MNGIRHPSAILALMAAASSPAAAASVPLADLVVDARVETVNGEIDLAAPGPPGSGLDFEPESRRAWGLGKASQIELRSLPHRGVLELTGRPFVHRGSQAQTVELAIDDEVFRTIRLAPWERTYRVRIPDRLLYDAHALLSLRYRWAAKPSEVLADSDDSRDLAVSWSALRIEDLGDSTPTSLERDGNEVVVRGGGRIRIPLRATGQVILSAAGIEANTAGSLKVRLDATDLAPVEASWTNGSHEALATTGGQTERHLRLTLRAAAGNLWSRLMALGLRRVPEVRIHGGEIRAEEISWPSRDLARVGYFPESSARAARPKLVVLWVVDTLRRDHLGLYGYQRDTSPRLDAFATDAVTFDRAVTQSAWTRPSVTSILTGQLLRRHGVYDKDDALAREATTLAELMHAAGYGTAAFITNGNLRHVGLEQGFATFRHAKEGHVREFHHPAGQVLEAAVEWLNANSGGKGFLYLHVSDPHMPYIPTPEFADLWPVEDPSIGTIDGYRATINSAEPATRDLIDLYDAEIHQADSAFGDLIDELQRRNLYDEALIVFTADHGEEFLDHGAWQHGNSLFAEQIAAPLVIHWPQGASPYAPGSRIDTVASHADLAPTVLAAADLTPPASMQGRDLADLESRPTFAELRDRFRASVDERYKLITDPEGRLLGLYDSHADPQERIDLTFSHPAVIEYHRRLQALFLERSRGGPGTASAEQDEETIEQLRALGYLD